jgi:CheY-like chemotaxis protein/predicted Ser/Thr protein kinase
MPTGAPTSLAERAHQVGIISLDQLRECWDELGTRNAAPEELLRVLQRKGYLTPFQIDKLKKGDTTGYFYGGNKVLYKIASGGFARVYRGISTQTGEPAAIKVLRQRWTSDPASLQAFYQEGQVGQMLRHPNIVRIDEVAGYQSMHYIAMEFIEGGNLRDFLSIRGGRLARHEAIRLMLEALAGLAYAFEQGVTHRDIKLTNVLASTQGTLKLVDFGLAAVHRDERRAEEAHGQRTVEYAMLEKTTGVSKGDPRSDIFFLGAVFYQMVAGTAPIPEKRDRAARLLRTRIDNVRPLREVYPHADAQLAAIIDRMMALDVHQRYQTPHEVIEALSSLSLTAPVVPRPAPTARPEPTGRAPNRTVLLLETDTGLQDAVRKKLHEHGYRVLITTDPKWAVERFKEQPPECTIVDCETTGQPGMNAFVTMAEFARGRKLPWGGILMLTPEQSEWACRITADDGLVVLIKPVKIGQLRDHVRRLAPPSADA